MEIDEDVRWQSGVLSERRSVLALYTRVLHRKEFPLWSSSKEIFGQRRGVPERVLTNEREEQIS